MSPAQPQRIKALAQQADTAQGGDVELPADFGLAPTCPVLAVGPYRGLLRVAFVAHLMRYILGAGGMATNALSVQLSHGNGTHPT